MDVKKGDDLFTLLLAEFRKACGGAPEAADEERHVPEFVDFARDYLKRNPVVSTYVADVGLGVRLQGGEAVPLVYLGEQSLRRDAVAITMPQTAPGMEGVSDRWSMPITKGT